MSAASEPNVIPGPADPPPTAPQDPPEHTDETTPLTPEATTVPSGSEAPVAEPAEPPRTDEPDTETALEADDGSDQTSTSTDQESAAEVVQNVSGNNGTVIGIQNISEIQRLRGTPLPDRWINAKLFAYLVRDDTTKAIDAILTAHRAAVIHAHAGTGRYTTALHALTSLHTKTIRQVRREPNEKVDLGGLKDEDTGWILDLRDETETLRTGFGLHLREVDSHLRETRSFLVVVTHTDVWKRVADEAPELDHPLTPADSLAVLRAHLSRQEDPVDELEKWLAEPKITQHLEGEPPGQAVRWAEKISTAVTLNSSTEDPKDFAELVDSVVQSVRNWRSRLLDWHTDHTASSHRTYMLAAAVLDGAPARTVYDAHAALGTALGDKPEPTKGQQGPGIIQLTHVIGAELGSDDRIRFLKPGYAEAVVDYFWVDRPHHVEAFTIWTADQAASLPHDLGTPLADRVSQWVTRYTLAKQSLTILRTITAHWANSTHLKGQAEELLVAAAIDPVTGRLARRRYLQWAKAPDTTDLTHGKQTPIALKRALAAALAQLGSAYPEHSLKRLSELAAHTNEASVTDAVGDALMDLWDQENLQEKIRTTLASWFDSAQDHYTAAARRAFLHLADRTTPDGTPVLATDGAGTGTWSLTGWRCALDSTATPQVQAAVSTWLNAALAHPGLRPAIIETFTEAIHRSDTDHTYLAQRYIVLNHAANGWEPAYAGQHPTERTRLRDELLIAMREADPTAPTRPNHAPNTP
ncbi:hypothetical protein ABTZ59_33450 [Streptomyces sp. NPDC094034]|uniref:hypothetical protein n=1 Tax=Streptomyces sp. NPDC094034 TaxID=3155309 RepID=UPI0033267259